jgi:oligosaccharide repeat unit polymerase
VTEADQHLNWVQAHYSSGVESMPAQGLGMVRRSWVSILLLTLPTACCGLALVSQEWALTGAGFILLSIICAMGVIVELLKFPERFGIGGLLLYGGTLIWFCDDYLVNWLGYGTTFFTPGPGHIVIDPAIVGKAAFWISLFVLMMGIGLKVPWGDWIVRQAQRLPYSRNPSTYIRLAIGLIIIGIIPYFLWCADPIYIAIPKTIIAGYSKEGAHWTAWRTGNIAMSWGSYIQFILELGLVGGILAGMYAALVAPTILSKVLGYACFAFETLLAFGSGARGQIAFMALPIIGFLFMKGQSKATEAGKRFSIGSLLVVGAVGLVTLGAVQYVAAYRDEGLNNGDIEDVHLFQVAGNHMFSEGLMGYALIPDQHDFFRDTFFGEGFIATLPCTFMDFIIHPIPRILWPNKPLDPIQAWYNRTYMGESSGGVQGVTITYTLPGGFYFQYGLFGVFEGGILCGWLMGMSERMLRTSGDNVIMMLLSLAVATWLFRCYRIMSFAELWEFLIGFILLCVALSFRVRSD